MERSIKPVAHFYKKGEEPSDFAYWQSRPPEERLDALEEIRKEYNEWKYGSQQRLQRIYSIVKR
ncbi:MAG: hypothetical protein ABSD46_07510 [Bacteroidota bacterium]|jgi:hypothetical protein